MSQEAYARVRVSRTIANEFADRCPEWVPDEMFEVGIASITVEAAKVLLGDAEYQSDKESGPDLMPEGVRRAYAALAKQLRSAIDKAQGEAK